MFVLKHNDSFAILDATGDMHGRTEKEHDIADGFITRDTRMLAARRLTVDGDAPAVRSSAMDENAVAFQAELTSGGVTVTRTLFVFNDTLFEKTTLANTADAPRAVTLAFETRADFFDLFEIRGAERKARGTAAPAETGPQTLSYGYKGLDGKDYKTTLCFSQAPDTAQAGKTAFTCKLDAGRTTTLYTTVTTDGTALPATEKTFEDNKKAAEQDRAARLARRPVITSSNQAFNDWVALNAKDIALLTTETATGPYPYAGIPWYSTAFGRDGIITAFQLLWQDPALARGVLSTLAHYQATETSAFHDSEPGKIMHEIRRGEMAAMKEIPHTPYYGTADATALFISLAGAYFARTGDIDFIATLWPNIEAALGWIDDHGDKDGDGFVEYLRGAESGLGNQGWKDSADSISHADGKLAEGAIALCEVQGYVYDARKSAARIAAALGKTDMAAKLEQQAEDLKAAFNDKFWSDDLGTYALALDGEKNPCLVSASNPGHLLFSGIATPARAKKTAERLMASDMFTGWGIRTLSSKEKRYEPVKPPEGYHNGTVWVHDTAICAAGFMRYGMEEKAAEVMTALFEAAQNFPHMRLPELFGGLPRNGTDAPVPYPVACNPQAWASASESMLLQAMLGIRIDGQDKTVSVQNPQLPAWLDDLKIENLRVGDKSFDLHFERDGDKVKARIAPANGNASANPPSPKFG
jgi:glycogen debranching enzyme